MADRSRKGRRPRPGDRVRGLVGRPAPSLGYLAGLWGRWWAVAWPAAVLAAAYLLFGR